ncbi:HNH endonuclease signature motif containing protein [Pandoraea communis]|uniref:HNH endonuclease signature motif containing protein n=1 Tax=Pandoraea communis TaxID=2508297 RepID=UPI0025A62C87|nr:HNH endonuclease signature motif containing protein [Pandoraea communis]MDM8357510.1 HNH endonuclease signature motif containing protein [Pandoraea communis]
MTTIHLCQCGCGQETRVAPVNDRSKGWVKGQPLKFIKGHGIGRAVAEKTARAIGRRTISSHGYVIVRLGANARQYEHILVAEKALGRPLRNYGRGNPATEVVHHVNGDKRDNRPGNLLICSHEYHVSLHHRLANSPAWPEFIPVSRPGFGEQR